MNNVYRVLCLLSVVGWCVGERVLVVFSVPRRSHSILGDSIVSTLLEAGYEVTYVSPFPREHATRLTRIDVASTSLGHDDVPLPSLLTAPPSASALQLGPAFASRVLQHEAIQKLLRDPAEQFHAVVADWYYSGLLAPLASVFSCPLVWYSSVDLSWQQLLLVHEASSPAYSADLSTLGSAARRYGVLERLTQTWLQVYLGAWGYYITKYVEEPLYQEGYSPAFAVRGRSLPVYEALVSNASLLLANSHPPLGQGLPTPPSVRMVGGHHVGPVSALSQKLKMRLDSAQDGVILLNLGPDFPSKDLPSDLRSKLLKMFELLEQTVVCQMEQLPVHRPKNLIVLKTVPQISILNHPNTVMIITAGDALSIIEATHAGVPVVGLPLREDQFFNVEQLARRGVGLRVEAKGDVVLGLYQAIHEILTNSSYRVNARTSASLFRRRQHTASSELLYYLQLVISSGGAAHLRSPALELSTTERYNLDAIAGCAMLAWFLTKVAKVLRAHLAEDGGDKKND